MLKRKLREKKTSEKKTNQKKKKTRQTHSPQNWPHWMLLVARRAGNAVFARLLLLCCLLPATHKQSGMPPTWPGRGSVRRPLSTLRGRLSRINDRRSPPTPAAAAVSSCRCFTGLVPLPPLHRRRVHDDKNVVSWTTGDRRNGLDTFQIPIAEETRVTKNDPIRTEFDRGMNSDTLHTIVYPGLLSLLQAIHSPANLAFPSIPPRSVEPPSPSS